MSVTWTELGPAGVVVVVLDDGVVVDELLPVPDDAAVELLEELELDDVAVPLLLALPEPLDELDEQDDELLEDEELEELPHGTGDGPRLPGGAMGEGEKTYALIGE
ncbi:MAG: hypothetical protein E6J14_15175 [Chloroflexi bacterium]|nr:MAG: hypothetical protein E6J14_15175 [Chloroflexota bacterium]